jgi:hypothetical protein
MVQMSTAIRIAERDAAVKRGLAFIYGTACNPKHFQEYGEDYLCFFYCISATSSDTGLRNVARALGRELARQWRRDNPKVPITADADDVAAFVFGNDAADRLGVRDNAFKQQLRKLAANFDARDYMFFDPATEPPATDVPADCDCGLINRRGRKRCRRCKSELAMNSAYWVWCMALTKSYAGERHGIRLGTSFQRVLKWLPAMRPYPSPGDTEDGDDFYWAVYAVTHVVYALNDYSSYKLSPAWLPKEYAFLKRALSHALKTKDPEMMGELLDTLRSFGLTENHPLIKKGVDYLLSCQNEDGSWGDSHAEDIYDRYHPTWTAIDALREYAWRGERLSLQRLSPLVAWCAKQPDGKSIVLT